jgi:hypothetical protein
VSDGATLTVLDAQGSPTESLAVSLSELSIPLARGLIYGLSDLYSSEGLLRALAGPQLDQALFTFNLANFHRRPRVPACPGDQVRSGLIHEYLDRGITFYWPLCAEIRSSLTESYPYVTWNSLAWHDLNTVKPLGVIYETLAAKVSDTIGAYQAQTSRTVTISSGYRTPKGNGSAPGSKKNTSRHMSGEAVDLQVPGYLSGSHPGLGETDTSSPAYLTWLVLKDTALANGATNHEDWVYMYRAWFQATGLTNGQNHMHANWEGGHR